MAIVFRNNATTALASDITNSATSITVTDGSKLPSITGSDYFYCTLDDGTNNEIVKVTAISGNTLTVVRAQDNTTARAFSTGDLAELRLTAAVLETFSQLDAGEITADEFIGDLRGAVIFKAQAGESLSKGDVVYVSGITGNTPVISKADADVAAKMPAFGLVLTTASLNASTEVVTFGTISGVDTSAFSLGDTLYVSTTPGNLTATKPAGESALIQNIGKVQRVHASAGSIKVGGAGRTNDVPNLNDGNIFIGNGSNQSSTASLNTKVEEYLDGGTSTPTFSTLNVSGNTTLTGDLTVNGTTTSLNTNTLDVEDKNITLNYSTGDSSASADGSGITIQDAVDASTDATILWDAANDQFDFSHGITLPDNKKAIFGTGSDLSIFHDGANSFIDDSGTGNLYIRANNLWLQKYTGETFIKGVADAEVTLYHNNQPKLATTSTGIDVTGTVTADNEINIENSSGYGRIEIGGTSGAYLDLKAPSSDDYDVRLITTGTSGELLFPSGSFVFKRGSLQKLAVTSTGIDVTGTVTSDGLTVDSTTGFSWLPVSTAGIELGTIGTGTGIIINTPSVNSSYGSGLAIDGSYASDLSSVNIKAFGAKYNSYGSELNLFTSDDTSLLKRLAIASTGDISFYDDTGTSQNLKWDASADSLQFVDNAKATFGAGSDLQIYHDGSNSYIKDVGTGSLILEGTTSTQIKGSTYVILRSNAGENMLIANANGSVDSYYDGVKKLATTSTGIDVTGTVTSDGLTVDGEGRIEETGDAARLVVARTDNANAAESASMDLLESTATGGSFGTAGNYGFRLDIDGSANTFNIKSGVQTSVTKRFQIGRDTGDISFYDDTGSTQGLFWDSSAESLGIGTTAPAGNLHIKSTGNVGDALLIVEADADNNVESDNPRIELRQDGNLVSGALYLEGDAGTTATNALENSLLLDAKGASSNGGTIQFATGGLAANQSGGPTNSAVRMTILRDGNIGIGTDSPSAKLDVLGDDTSGASITWKQGTRHSGYLYSDTSGVAIYDTNLNNAGIYLASNNRMDFRVNGTERMRLDSSGNLLVGKTSAVYNTAGTQLAPDGQVFITGGNQYGLAVNRTTADGDVVLFSKDGATVGSIGTKSGDLNIGTGDVGLQFWDGGDSIYAWNTSNDSGRDAAVDLGYSGVRFKDLYLSSSAIIEDDASSPSILVKAAGQTASTTPTASIILANGSLSSNASAPAIISYRDADYSTTALRSSGLKFQVTRSNAGVEAITINSFGKVGIAGATTIDDGNLQIGDSDADFNIAIAGARSKFGYDSSNNSAVVQGGITKGIIFCVNNSTFGSGEAGRFDASGNLLVGTTTAPNTLLGASSTQGVAFNGGQGYLVAAASGQATAYFNRQTSDGTITEFRKDGSTVGSIGTGAGILGIGLGTGNLGFLNASVIPMGNTSGGASNGVIDLGNGNRRFKDLYLSGHLKTGGGGSNSTGEIEFVADSTRARIVGGYQSGGGGYLKFHTDTTGGSDLERMRLDSSGELLAGKTSADNTTAGHRLSPSGFVSHVRSGNEVMILNRLSSDGSILTFRQDGENIGSIGVTGTDFYIGRESSSNLRFQSAGIRPSTGASLADDTYELGGASARFTNLHLANQVYINGTTPNIRFTDSDTGADSQITASSGYGALVLKADYNNETAGSYIGFEVDGSEAGRFDTSGNLLVGTTTAGYASQSGVTVNPAGASYVAVTHPVDSTSGNSYALFTYNAGIIGSITQNGTTGVSYNTSSDARLKDVTGEARGLEVITKLNPVAYNWKADGKADEGLIAQEVKELVPNAVTGSEDEHYQMDYSKLVTHLVKAVQELEQQTIELKEEIANLKGE